MHQPRTLALDKGRHSFYTQGNGEQVNSIRLIRHGEKHTKGRAGFQIKRGSHKTNSKKTNRQNMTPPHLEPRAK